jgi:hypothetical protein
MRLRQVHREFTWIVDTQARMSSITTRMPAGLTRVRAIVAACVVVAIILRLPWFGAAFGLDEGGLSSVATGWFNSHGSLYGSSWVDRPPLLLLVWRAALVVGPIGIRLLGAAAAAALVVLVARLALEVGGPRAARWGAALTAVLASSAAISSIFTPAELLAAVPTSASILALLMARRIGHEPAPSTRRMHALLVLAGALACAACLIKQSSIDSAAAGVVAIAVGTQAGAGWRGRASTAAAWIAGAAAACLPVLAWIAITDVTLGQFLYAIFGFRVDALHAIGATHASLSGRLPRLWMPFLGSGLALLAPWVLLGATRPGLDRGTRAILLTWLAAGTFAVLAGGSYWAHYLIQLVPVCGVLAALVLARTRVRWLARATLCAMVVLGVGGFALGAIVEHEHPYQHNARVVGSFIADNARRDDTIYVMYAHANVAWYSGLQSPYPYRWSLMLRTIRSADQQLATLLASDRRPTWLVQWQPITAYEQSKAAQIDEAIEHGYRRVATPCGHPVFVRSDVVRPLHARPGSCVHPNSVTP